MLAEMRPRSPLVSSTAASRIAAEAEGCRKETSRSSTRIGGSLKSPPFDAPPLARGRLSVPSGRRRMSMRGDAIERRCTLTSPISVRRPNDSASASAVANGSAGE
jgi:hypothetical protein